VLGFVVYETQRIIDPIDQLLRGANTAMIDRKIPGVLRPEAAMWVSVKARGPNRRQRTVAPRRHRVRCLCGRQRSRMREVCRWVGRPSGCLKRASLAPDEEFVIGIDLSGFQAALWKISQVCRAEAWAHV
jgi:hypothetical protein